MQSISDIAGPLSVKCMRESPGQTADGCGCYGASSELHPSGAFQTPVRRLSNMHSLYTRSSGSRRVWRGASAESCQMPICHEYPAYLQVRQQTGVAALALRLNHILVEHIRALLPSLRSHVEAASVTRSEELRRYGASPPGSTSAAR